MRKEVAVQAVSGEVIAVIDSKSWHVLEGVKSYALTIARLDLAQTVAAVISHKDESAVKMNTTSFALHRSNAAQQLAATS